MTCVICRNDSSNQYQCCSNNEHKFCESCCLNIISSISEKGKIVSLMNGKVPCYVCNKKLKCERFPESVHIILNHILSTVPKTSKKPKSIQDFNYYYNQFDQLRHCITNKKFVFLTQRHYELLGKCIEIYIQSLIKNDQWNYEEIWLPIENHYQNYVNIFISDDFKINENGCLILIQGSGVVRAGQWSRYCCINESLDIGGSDL